MSDQTVPETIEGAPHNRHKPYPSVLDIRARLLAAAGFDEPAQVSALQAVIQSALDDLAAMQTTPISKDGIITDVHAQANHAARGKAREQLLKLIGVDHIAESPQKGNTVIIAPPAWMKLTLEASNSPSEAFNPVTATPEPLPSLTASAPHGLRLV
jgi:hypothetical protein